MAGSGQHIIVKIGGEVLGSLTSSIRQAQTQISSLGKNVSRTMTDAAGAGAKGFKRILNSDAYQAAATAAAGVGFALAGSVKSAAAFESVLTDIGKVSGASGSELKQLGLQLSALSARNKTNLAPTVLAAGLQDLVAQGLSLDQAIASMETLGKVATATGSELTDVTKTGFQLQNALKIKPTELKATFDALAFAGKQGAFELKDMAQHMPTIAAAAGTLGIQGKAGAISLGAMMQMVRKDAPDAAQSATRLTDAMLKMTAPQTVKNFAKFGVNIEKVLKDAKAKGINPMEAALDTLQKVTKGDAFKLGEIFGDKEAKLALMSLMKYRKEYDKLKADAGGAAAAGTVEQDYLRSLNTLQGNLDTFKAASERLGIALGNALLPALSAAANFITPLVSGFAALSEQAPWLTSAIVTLGAVFAGLTLALPFISAGISVFTALGAAIAGAGGAGAVLAGALAVITGPIGLTVAAVVAIGAALVFAYTKVEWFRNAVNGAFEGVKNIVMGVVNYIKGIFQVLWGILSGDTQLIKTGFDNVVNGIKQAFGGLVGFIGSILGGIGNAILSIPKLIGAAFIGIVALIRNIFTGLATLGTLIVQGIGSALQSVVGVVTQVFGGVPQAILAVMFPIPALIAAIFTRVGPSISGPISGAVATARGLFSQFVAFLQGIPGMIAGVGSAIVQTIINGIKARIGALFATVQGALAKVRSLLPSSDAETGPLSNLTGNGAAILQTLAKGVQSVGDGGLGQAMSNGLSSTLGQLPGFAQQALNGAASFLSPTPMGGAPIAAPVAAAAGAGGSFGGQTINANFTINAPGGDGNAIAEKVKEIFADLLADAQAGQRAYLND